MYKIDRTLREGAQGVQKSFTRTDPLNKQKTCVHAIFKTKLGTLSFACRLVLS